MLTVPGLKVTTDWASVHDRLLDDFPDVIDVLATTMPATLLIAYAGEANIDAWLEGISDGIRSRRARAGHPATDADANERPKTSGPGVFGEHATLAWFPASPRPTLMTHHPQS